MRSRRSWIVTGLVFLLAACGAVTIGLLVFVHRLWVMFT